MSDTTEWLNWTDDKQHYLNFISDRIKGIWSFPSGSAVKNPHSVQELQETRIPSLGQKDPLEEGMGTHSSILPGESHGPRSLVGYSP